MPLGKPEIAALIPHAGTMCLLDGVTRWDETSVSAFSRTHLHEANPLRSADGLCAWCGIEYAVQAMAVHGALAGAVSARPRAGYLISLRKVACLAPRLDDLPGDLVVDAERLIGDDAQVVSAFSVRVGNREVLHGNAAVILDAGAGAS